MATAPGLAAALSSVVVPTADDGHRPLGVVEVENEPGAHVTVDLVSRTVTAGEIVAAFWVDDYTRWRLLEGHDDIGLTLRHEDQITQFETTRPSWKPTTQRVDTPDGRVAAGSTTPAS